MSARIHQAPATSSIVPGTQTVSRAFPILEANGTGPFTSYPPTPAVGTDDELLHTYESFNEEPILALYANTDTWTLCLPVPHPSPEHDNPTLLSLTYLLKYATKGDDGNSTVQTDILLTSTELSPGIISGGPSLSVYRPGKAYAPRMVDQAAAKCLATALAVKCNGGGDQWSHFLDVQHISPKVRIGSEVQLYLMFHVAEYPTARMMRSLSIEVSATWQKEAVEINAREDAERKAEEEQQLRDLEAAKKEEREKEEQVARNEEREWRNEERYWRNEEKEWRELRKSDVLARKAEADEGVAAFAAMAEAEAARVAEAEAARVAEAEAEAARVAEAEAEAARLAEAEAARLAKAEAARVAAAAVQSGGYWHREPGSVFRTEV